MTTAPGRARRVIVTQATGTGRVARLLRERGIDVWELPAIQIAPPVSWDALDSALGSREPYDWIVVTSGNAARAVVERAQENSFALTQSQIAAVGDATADVLQRGGYRVDVIPSVSTGERLCEELLEREDLAEKRVLFPCSDIALPTVPERLRTAGAIVHEAVCYRTMSVPIDGSAVIDAVRTGEVAAVTFASPSSVGGFSASFSPEMLSKVLGGIIVVSIGPTTSTALRRIGREPDIEADTPNAEGLVNAVLHALEETG